MFEINPQQVICNNVAQYNVQSQEQIDLTGTMLNNQDDLDELETELLDESVCVLDILPVFDNGKIVHYMVKWDFCGKVHYIQAYEPKELQGFETMADDEQVELKSNYAKIWGKRYFECQLPQLRQMIQRGEKVKL